MLAQNTIELSFGVVGKFSEVIVLNFYNAFEVEFKKRCRQFGCRINVGGLIEIHDDATNEPGFYIGVSPRVVKFGASIANDPNCREFRRNLWPEPNNDTAIASEILKRLDEAFFQNGIERPLTIIRPSNLLGLSTGRRHNRRRRARYNAIMAATASSQQYCNRRMVFGPDYIS